MDGGILSWVNPVDLILNRSHCLFLVENTNLVCLGLMDQQARFVNIIDDVLGKGALLTDHIKLQIGILRQY